MEFYNGANFAPTTANIKGSEHIKKIILNKIPLNEDGRPLLALETISAFHNSLYKALGKDYIVITSPMEMQVVDGDDIIITIDCKSYTYNELMELINSKKGDTQQ